MKADWGWARVERVDPVADAKPDEMMVTIKYNLRHPSFRRVLWNALEMRPAIFKPLVFLWALRYLIRAHSA